MASAGQEVNHLDALCGEEVPDIWDSAYVIVDFASGARAMLELCMYAEGSKYREERSTFCQHRRFFEVVRGRAAPEVTLEDGTWAVRLGLAAQRAALSGQAVVLQPLRLLQNGFNPAAILPFSGGSARSERGCRFHSGECRGKSINPTAGEEWRSA